MNYCTIIVDKKYRLDNRNNEYVVIDNIIIDEESYDIHQLNHLNGLFSIFRNPVRGTFADMKNSKIEPNDLLIRELISKIETKDKKYDKYIFAMHWGGEQLETVINSLKNINDILDKGKEEVFRFSYYGSTLSNNIYDKKIAHLTQEDLNFLISLAIPNFTNNTYEIPFFYSHQKIAIQMLLKKDFLLINSLAEEKSLTNAQELLMKLLNQIKDLEITYSELNNLMR